MALAATTAGSAAEARAAKKVAKYALCEPGGYDFTPPMLSHAHACTRMQVLWLSLIHISEPTRPY